MISLFRLECMRIDLDISTDDWPTGLKSMVVSFQRPNLDEIRFLDICFTEGGLIKFCTRHAGTLKDFHASHVFLTEG